MEHKLHFKELYWFLELSDEDLRAWCDYNFSGRNESHLAMYTSATNNARRSATVLSMVDELTTSTASTNCPGMLSSSSAVEELTTYKASQNCPGTSSSPSSSSASSPPTPTTSRQPVTMSTKKYKNAQTPKKNFRKRSKCCSFCFKNNELPQVYNSHRLRDRNGNIECEFLRDKVCETCGASGDTAHTPKYCPQKTTPFWEVA